MHTDGEIWAQTLWQLRGVLGSRTSESLVTRAMELAPHNPSFLDMRNAILVADTALFGGRHHDDIWKVFAARGMGFYAGSFGGDDIAPGASFAKPPAGHATGRIEGTVSDPDTGKPVPGATVTLAFQGRGAVNPSTVTDAQGHYSLGPVPRGRYSKLEAEAPGYLSARSAVTVGKGSAHSDFSARRDWAASSGARPSPTSTAPTTPPAAAAPSARSTSASSTAGRPRPGPMRSRRRTSSSPSTSR